MFPQSPNQWGPEPYFPYVISNFFYFIYTAQEDAMKHIQDLLLSRLASLPLPLPLLLGPSSSSSSSSSCHYSDLLPLLAAVATLGQHAAGSLGKVRV